ncbi:hypothetical protein IH601_12635 [Candidatus Bipolaricaulota bacterium]|nr:hypothetical protein [Candidatus Bipolaricaulota bacterium]TFH07584.1 MAG: hypothetical protein E4H08_09270 [Candidatus Atribacteria bacterium]
MKPFHRAALGALLWLIPFSICLGATPDLEGTWAMVQVYPQIAILPFAGEVERTSHVVQWVDITQDGETLIMQDRYCLTAIDDGTLLVKTVIPDAFMSSLQPTVRVATLAESDSEILFIQDVYTEVRGAMLTNPQDDALPTDPDDPRVVDQDKDGYPGLTVSVSILGIIEGATYVVQRVRYALSGKLISPDRIEGTMEWSDEQTVLDATNALLKADTIGYPDPDPTRHLFIMLRLDGPTTCEWLGEHWRGLFGLELRQASSCPVQQILLAQARGGRHVVF